MLAQVPVPEEQHRIMIEGVENHMPEVIVIDEIGTEAEAVAARTIAQRGLPLFVLWAWFVNKHEETTPLNPRKCTKG